jgi:hypothetical protein
VEDEPSRNANTLNTFIYLLVVCCALLSSGFLALAGQAAQVSVQLPQPGLVRTLEPFAAVVGPVVQARLVAFAELIEPVLVTVEQPELAQVFVVVLAQQQEFALVSAVKAVAIVLVLRECAVET